MAVEECSLYTFTVGGVSRKTTPKDVAARKAIATKQDALTNAQLEAVNSGITAAVLNDILVRLTALEGGS